MNQNVIGGLDSFIREKDVHDLMQALAKNQTLTEQMVIAARGDQWNLALTLIRQELDPDHRSTLRKMTDYVMKALGREKKDGVDSGSTLVEDLPIPGTVGLSDVVVSWADSEKELAKEVESIRSCLDALGIFDEEGQKALQEVHVEHMNLGVGEVSVRLDNEKHRFQTTANLKVGRILSLLGHLLPGVGDKTEIGATMNLRIPYNDSRNKFIAALLALELQSNNRMYTCTQMKNMRDEWDIESEDDLRQQWKKTNESMAYLRETFAAVDNEMQKAYLAHPTGESEKVHYNCCLRALDLGYYDRAIQSLESIQGAIIPIKRAMGENYYLFAANVILQAQVAGFADDLKKIAKERFGVDLSQPVAESKVARAAETPSSPPAFLARKPGSRP